MMRTGSAMLVAIALTTVLAGCGSAPGSAGKKTDQRSAADKRAGIEVTSTGTGERAPLRLTVKPGATEKLTMYLDMAVRNGSGAAAQTVTIPTVAMQMDATVDDVHGDTIRSTFGYQNVRVDGRGAALEQLREQLKVLAGLHGVMETDRRGLVKKADFAIPAGLSSPVSGLLQSLKTQMQSLSVPYPTEAVGVGATWTVRHHVTLAGISSEVASTYELVGRSGNQIVLSATTEQNAPEQDPALPGMPTGTTVHLARQKTSGSGRTTVDLALPLAVAYSSVATTDFEMTIKAPGQSQTVDEHMSMKMRMVRR